MEQLSKGAEKRHQKCKITRLTSSIKSNLKLSEASTFTVCVEMCLAFLSFPWETGKLSLSDMIQTKQYFYELCNISHK